MEESSYIHKSHNVTVLIYHLVTPAKYRRVIFNEELDDYLCKICEDIEARYEISRSFALRKIAYQLEAI